MSQEACNILLPFNYLMLNEMPLRQSSYLEYEYDKFLRRYIWQFIDAYNYQFVVGKHVRFCLQTSQNCVFEGELWTEKESFFRTFKVNKTFLRTPADFVEWEQFITVQNLAKLEYLAFDFFNQWLSIPNDTFFTHFQRLREVKIKCCCTAGFNNLINVNEIEETFCKALPHTEIVIDIDAKFPY